MEQEAVRRMGKAGKALVALLALLLILASAYRIYVARIGRSPAAGAWPTAAQYVAGLRVGISVDWLKYPWVTRLYLEWRGKGVNIPALLRERGFDHVRIRVAMDVVGNETALRLIKMVVDDCLKANVTPIIVYTARELRSRPLDPAVQKHFVEWWATLAQALHGESSRLAYELLIETSGALQDKPWLVNRLYNETIAEIRGIDPYRVIIVTAPANRSSPFSLPLLRLPRDPWLAVEWHIYAGGPRPGPEPVYNATLVREAVRFAAEWSEETGIPVWMGAWRPNRYPRAAMKRAPKLPDGAPAPLFTVDEVVNFTRLMAGALCRAGIPFAINDDTKFFDYQHLRFYPSQEPLLEVMFSYNCARPPPWERGS